MIRKLSAILCILVLFPVFAVPAPVQAAGPITVTVNSADLDFPSYINFTISAESNSDIADIRLHYYVDRISYARVISEIYIPVLPARNLSTQWTWDMRKTGGLPPGTVIYYWWTIENAAGAGIATDPIAIRFDDTRYEWKTVSKDNITLFWYEGNAEFSGNLLSAAVEGLKKLRENTGLDFTDPVEIYIYEDTRALRNGMIFPQEWTGGVAYPSYGCIAIGIQASELAWGMRTVVHELTHLVIHRITDNPYLDLPTWLDEGLAMYMEGPLQDTFNHYIYKAIDENALISVRSLASPFSAYADLSYLSYAESYYLVEYLITEYGNRKMLELLMALSNGTEYDTALEQVYGFDMDGLNTEWLDYMGVPETLQSETTVTALLPQDMALARLILYPRSI
ncbi:MAG: peptidase MA domain-containing protein [Dehalococcoidales bacterium]|nr:peptidase MA domain-containing protein [Dehalococcoidales bacterium]